MIIHAAKILQIGGTNIRVGDRSMWSYFYYEGGVVDGRGAVVRAGFLGTEYVTSYETDICYCR